MDFRQAALAKLLANRGGGSPIQGLDSPGGSVWSKEPVVVPPTTAPMESRKVSTGSGTLGKVGQSSQATRGVMDPRSLLGIFLRGNNVYPGGLPNAHAGSNVNMGRPRTNDRARAFRRVNGS